MLESTFLPSILFFSVLLLANQIIVCLSMVRHFCHSRGMFLAKGKEGTVVINCSCIALIIDSTYFHALCHIVLLITL